MLKPHRCLIVLFSCSLIGCQTGGMGTTSWFPLARRTPPETTATADSVPVAAAERQVAEAAPSESRSGTSVVAKERIEQLIADGQNAIRDERYDDARQAFRDVLASAPSHTTAHHGLAIASDLTEDWTEAEYHYKQALRTQPRDPNLLNDLGYSYLLQNRFHEAARYLNQAIELEPAHEHAQINLALLSLRQGDRPDAIQRLNTLFPPAVAQQHLARLENQVGTPSAAPAAPAMMAPTAPNSPGAGMPLTDVMQLAAEQRRQAEAARDQRYSQNTIPASDTAAGDPRFYQASGSIAPQIAPATMTTNQAYTQAQTQTQNQHLAGQMPQSGLVQQVQQSAAAPAGNSPEPLRPLGRSIPIHASSSPAPAATMQFPGTQPQQSQYPSSPTSPTSPANSGMSLLGLNAGPGALFPVQHGGAAAPVQATTGSPPPQYPSQYGYPPASSMPQPSVQLTTPSVTMGSPVHGAPGANTLLNGAMFPEVPRVLPAEQLRAVSSTQSQPPYAPSQVPSPTGFGPPAAMAPAAMAPAANGYPAPQAALPQQLPAGWVQPNTTMMPQSPSAGTAGSQYAPGSTLAAPSPLTEYERELQQLNPGYQQTLQQMNPSATAVTPVQARY